MKQNHDVHLRRLVQSLVLVVCCLLPILSQAEEGHSREIAAVDTLVWVNGAAITTTDLDRLLQETHGSMSKEGMEHFKPKKLLSKAINDELLLQQAEALDLENEPEVVTKLDEIKSNAAISLWIRDHYAEPDTVSEEQIMRSYRVNYERIQLRQISLRTKQEAEAARRKVLAGASMDSMARSSSLDTKKLEGGLHHELPLLEIPAPLLNAGRNLQQGELSPVFPYKDAWSFVRMEKRAEAPDEPSEEARKTVTKILLGHEKKTSWRNFVDQLKQRVHLNEVNKIFAAMRADSTKLFSADFLKGTNDPAIVVDNGPSISDQELRQEISHQAMNDGTATFSADLKRATDAVKESLILEALAERDGYAESPEVRTAYENARRKTLIQAYLGEAIVPEIKFSHAEFKDFYDRNKEKWRGADQVLLDMIVLSDKEKADDLAKRLEAGSDFDRIKGEYEKTSAKEESDRSWASTASFNDEMRDTIATMQVGEVVGPKEISQGWLFYQLDGRKSGKIPTMEEMDAKIRSVMFQKKFNVLLDNHLDLLKSRSTIVRNEPAIDGYFSRGS